jgi:hypothetical protein
MLDDLPDELAGRVLRVFPDNGDSYLWDLNACCMEVVEIGGTESLEREFEAWARHWDRCFDLRRMEVDKLKLGAECFDEQGLLLARQLKRFVGESRRVIYGFTATEHSVEILAEGGTRDWPPGLDIIRNREWLLKKQHKQGAATS